ncbi:MAG: o-succinylbenzoate synthase, partial [Thermoprotei archaeon]
MEIEKIELYGVQMPLACPFRTSFGVTSSRHVILVRVIERGGEEGWG